jgi:hypothetical protein
MKRLDGKKMDGRVEDWRNGLDLAKARKDLEKEKAGEFKARKFLDNSYKYRGFILHHAADRLWDVSGPDGYASNGWNTMRGAKALVDLKLDGVKDE